MVEVAHEALLRHWPKLEDWIADRRDSLLVIRQLQADCRGWLAKGKPSSHVWPHERAREAAEAITKLGDELVLSDDERVFLGPIDPNNMMKKLAHSKTGHRLRHLIGERLDRLGDPRSGVGLHDDGLPDIDWCHIEGGIAHSRCLQIGRRNLTGSSP